MPRRYMLRARCHYIAGRRHVTHTVNSAFRALRYQRRYGRSRQHIVHQYHIITFTLPDRDVFFFYASDIYADMPARF